MPEIPIRLEPVWVNLEAVLALHDRQLAEHGGGEGLRDAGALESALARPRNRWEYGEDDRAAIAAAYAFGIARNHPFVDGNKRTAWVVARLFLRLNGETIAYKSEDAIRTVLALAAGGLAEDEFAGWFRERLN
jgi:death-on-curing protein